MFNHHGKELRPPVDAYVDWEDNEQLAAYWAEYGKRNPYFYGPSQTAGTTSTSSTASFLFKVVLLFAVLFGGMPATILLVGGGIIYAITGSEGATICICAAIALAILVAAIVIFVKMVKKWKNKN